MNKNTKQRLRIAHRMKKSNGLPASFVSPANGKTFQIAIGYVPGHTPYKHRNYKDPREKDRFVEDPAGGDNLKRLVAEADLLLKQRAKDVPQE